VFEPHTFTWRNRTAIAQYDRAFEGAERVYIYEPAKQGAHTHAQLSQDEIVARVRATGMDTAMLNGQDDLKVILRDTKQDDAILLLTSGELGGLIKSLPPAIERAFPLAE
jgi:UDP-N-acetylmuramate: L-alanyl-gamma-D-glutamyl-meso-diaminopimelate ligase